MRSKSIRSKSQGNQTAADKAHAVRTINIISQQQYFVARCLIPYVGNVVSLHSTVECILSEAQ
jgi:hypothetical protein